MLSTEGEVGGTKLRTGKLTEDEWVRLIEAGGYSLEDPDLF